MRTSWLVLGAVGVVVACGDDSGNEPPVDTSPDGGGAPSSSSRGGGVSSSNPVDGGSSFSTTNGPTSSPSTDVATSTQQSDGSETAGGASMPDSGSASCRDACEPDAIRCDNQAGDWGVQRCETNGETGCPEWRAVNDCESGSCLPNIVENGCVPEEQVARCESAGIVVCAPAASGCPVWQAPTSVMRTDGDLDIDEGATEFNGYGRLELRLSSEVPVREIAVCLTDTRDGATDADSPAVADVVSLGNGAYEILLSRYQLPVAYQLQVAAGNPVVVRTTVLAPDERSRVAFISRTTGPGDLTSWTNAEGGSLEAADAVCQADAEAAGLSGTFSAFLSVDNQTDAICRLRGGEGLLGENCGLDQPLTEAQLTAPFLDLRGMPIAYGTADIQVGLWRLPVGYSSDGTPVSRSLTAWTGSEITGVFADGDCAGWSSLESEVRGSAAGSPAVSAPAGAYSSRCDGEKALLCFAGGEGHPLALTHERSGKAAFIVELGLNAEVDVSSADEACQTAAGRDDVVAWFSDESHDALCRLAGLPGKVTENCGENELPLVVGPWVRSDGYPVAETSEDVLSGLLSPITLGWEGAYSPHDETQELVRTNTQAYGGRGVVTSATSCISGDRATIGSGWTYISGTCSTSVDFRTFVYCFER